MRLIDADKLHYIRKWFEDSNKSEVVVFAKEIDKAPTVDAIPVEWIQRWWDANYKYADVEVGDLLNDWISERKEE